MRVRHSSIARRYTYGQPPVVGPDGVTRGAFANGGPALQLGMPMHPAIAAAFAAMNQRPHFEDGGESDGSSHSNSSSSGGSDNGGDGHGSGESSSASGSSGGVGGFGGGSNDGYGGGSSSGSSGGVGGFGGGSSDGYGGGSSSSSGGGFSVGSSGSSGSAGGVGGFGGGSSDGYGGGSSSSGSNSNASSGSSGGVGGFGGGSSDGYGGGSSSGTQSSGGFSSGAASGADSGSDSGGVGGSVSSSGVMGGAGLSGGAGYGSSTSSGDVGSMGGSFGAPAAGGFSSEGAPATGGFGNFGATPAATSNPSGLTGVSPSASMMSGYTAGQSMANEAAHSEGEAGEDGTNGLGGVSTSGAFNSFGPSTQQGFGSPSPFGGMDNARSAFGASSDGTMGTTPSSVAASNPNAVAGLSPSGQALGVMGMSGMDGNLAGAMNVGTAGALNGPGAFGMSTMNRDGSMPGFDNFSPTGSVQQSSLGAPGYGGTDLGSVNPAGSYTTPSGVQTGALTGALQGGLPSAQGYVGSYAGLSPAVAGALAAAGQPDTSAPTTPAQAPEAYHGVSPAVLGGMLGDIGDVFGGFSSLAQAAPSAVASPYGTLSKTPMGPLNVGSLGQAMGTDRTSDTAGVNADGDPTAVNGMSALTIHGTLTPGAQTMSDGVPTGPGIVTHMSPSYAAADGLAANRVYSRTADAQDSGAPPSMIANTAGRDTQSLGMGLNPSSMTDTSFGPATQDAPAGITDSQVAQARQNLSNGTGTDQDRATVQSYLNQQNTPSDGMHPAVARAMAAAGSDTTTGPLTVSPQTLGDYTTRMQKFESGNDPNAVSPTGAFGLSQFTQRTWAGVRQNYPGMNLPANRRDATAEQQASATDALTNENVRGLQKVGITPTYAAVYAAHNAGISVAKGIFSAPDNASVSSVVPASTIAANPQVFGGMDNIGQLKGHLADIMGQGVVTSAPAPIAPGRYANYSPGAASGMDTTAPSTFTGISPESTYSPGVATPATEPTTQNVTSPAPYSVSPEVQHALTINGLATTPANALAADTLGVANGIAVMNGEPSAPISSVDISPETVQAHPDLFSGVQTVGDLQGKITAAAPTAGFTTQTVTTPGTPAVNGLGDLPGYSYSPGAASGLDTPDSSAQETGISQPGVYGTPSPLTVTRGILAGQQPTGDGFSPGAASGADTSMDPTTPDGAPAKHLSVPNWAGNGVAGIAAGSLLGSAGTLLGFGNTLSGLFGGPTAADAINGALAHPGAPGSVTGSPTSASDSNASGREGPYNQPYSGSGSVGDGSGTGNDPQAASTAPAPGGALPYSAPPLTIRRRHQYYDTTTPSVSFYNPMTDPAVARALAAMRS